MTWSLLLIMITSHWDFWYTLYSKESSLLQLQPPSSWCYAGVIIINCIRLLMLHQNEVSRSLSSCFLLSLSLSCLLSSFPNERSKNIYTFSHFQILLDSQLILRTLLLETQFFSLFFLPYFFDILSSTLFSSFCVLTFSTPFRLDSPERFNFMEASHHEQRPRLVCCSFVWRGWCCRLLNESTPSDDFLFENEG